MADHDGVSRTFKTAWFAKAARGSAHCRPGVVRRDRASAEGVYAYLFAKKDRDNITDIELSGFRELADLYNQKTNVEIEQELKAGKLLEICNGHEFEIQERRF